MIPRSPGTYLLLLTISQPSELQIGRTQQVRFDAGLYCYAGSALGPGGLAARLGRYVSGTGRRHWHIDYLLPHAALLGALVVEDTQRLECIWAAWATGQAQGCVPGFGSSDCNCASHLLLLGAADDAESIIEHAQRDLGARWLGSAVG
ncbi:MAG: GIY-YIG nuclease family protein [Caldilineales bacterium]